MKIPLEKTPVPYRPFLMKARSWESVVQFYARFAASNQNYEPLQSLVVQIASSEFACALFPLTSMTTLFISQGAEIEWHREVLEINFDPTKQTFHFQYWERPDVEKRWTKECPAAGGFSTFERFLRLKKWFA